MLSQSCSTSGGKYAFFNFVVFFQVFEIGVRDQHAASG